MYLPVARSLQFSDSQTSICRRKLMLQQISKMIPPNIICISGRVCAYYLADATWCATLFEAYTSVKLLNYYNK